MSDKRSMFYGASPSIFEKAKMLRLNMTLHEKLLWEELRGNKVMGLRFKAQHPIDTFIADFYCHSIKLALEIDGESHNSEDQIEYDKNRNVIMNNLGITVLRFKNTQIENDINRVINTIQKECNDLLNN
jgi:very-short-patch-repair endonuclease